LSVKEEIVEETNIYFLEVKEKLKATLADNFKTKEQEQLYYELVQVSGVLNRILTDNETLTRTIEPIGVSL